MSMNIINLCSQAYSLVMGMLWKRLNDHGRNWRHVYKVPPGYSTSPAHPALIHVQCTVHIIHMYMEKHVHSILAIKEYQKEPPL